VFLCGEVTPCLTAALPKTNNARHRRIADRSIQPKGACRWTRYCTGV
jgi:hypothetical protein